MQTSINLSRKEKNPKPYEDKNILKNEIRKLIMRIIEK